MLVQAFSTKALFQPKMHQMFGIGVVGGGVRLKERQGSCRERKDGRDGRKRKGKEAAHLRKFSKVGAYVYH